MMNRNEFKHYYDNIKCPINKVLLLESISGMNKNLETILYKYKKSDKSPEYILLLSKDKEYGTYYGLTIMPYINMINSQSGLFLSELNENNIIDKFPVDYFYGYKIDECEKISQYKNMIMMVKSEVLNLGEQFPYVSMALYTSDNKRKILFFTKNLSTSSEFFFDIYTNTHLFSIAYESHYKDLNIRIGNKIELNYFEENFDILNDI